MVKEYGSGLELVLFTSFGNNLNTFTSTWECSRPCLEFKIPRKTCCCFQVILCFLVREREKNERTEGSYTCKELTPTAKYKIIQKN
jgi:hypothetical protein